MYPLPTKAELEAHYAAKRLDATDLQSEVLQMLLQLGADLIRLTQQQTANHAAALVKQAAYGTPPPPDLIIPFERLARAIHRTAILQAKILSPEALALGIDPTPEAPKPPTPPRTTPPEAPATAPAAPTAPTGAAPPAPPDPPRPASPARLERIDLLRDLRADIETRPVPELIAAIRRDFQMVLDPAPPDEPADPLAPRVPRPPRASHPDDYQDDDDEVWEAGLNRPPKPRPPPSG